MTQPIDLPRADDLEEEPDFVPRGTDSVCRHCGVVKVMSAKFFVEHFAACVKPRRE